MTDFSACSTTQITREQIILITTFSFNDKIINIHPHIHTLVFIRIQYAIFMKDFWKLLKFAILKKQI